MSLFYFLVWGYLLFNRTFSYIGLPAIRLFLGEVVLGFIAVFRGGRLIQSFGRVTSTHPGRALRLALTVFLGYGLLQVVRAFFLGHPTMEVLRDSAYTYYSLYLLVGIYLASRVKNHTERLKKFAYALAVLNGVYGILYVSYLGRLTEMTLPGTPNVWIFAQTSASAIAALLLISFFPMRKGVIFWLAVNILVMLGIQVRAEWLGFSVALVALSLLRGSLRLIAKVFVGILVLFTLAYVLEFRLVSPTLRGGELSARGILGRTIAPVDPEAAWQLSEHAGAHEGTYLWRTFWWAIIWDEAFGSTSRFLVGPGYGYDLAGLVGYGEATGLGGLRTPHSFIAFSVGYVGTIGLILFVLLQTSVIRFFLLSLKHLDEKATKIAQCGLILTLFWLAVGAFGSAFEAPYGAIPHYLMTGFLIGAVDSRRNDLKKLA